MGQYGKHCIAKRRGRDARDAGAQLATMSNHTSDVGVAGQGTTGVVARHARTPIPLPITTCKCELSQGCTDDLRQKWPKGHTYQTGTRACSQYAFAKLTVTCGGLGARHCATDTGTCASKTILKITSVLDMAISLAGVASWGKSAIKTAIDAGRKMSLIAAGGSVRRTLSASWKLTKILLKSSAVMLAKKMLEVVTAQLVYWNINSALTLHAWREATDAAATAFAAQAYIDEIAGLGEEYLDVASVAKMLDPTGISGVVDAFKKAQECDTIREAPPNVGEPTGKEFDYEWVPVCGASFAGTNTKSQRNHIDRICRENGYSKGGRKGGTIHDIKEDAYYTTQYQGDLAHTTPETGAIQVTGGMYDARFTLPPNWAKQTAAERKQQEVSGGAGDDSVGQGNCGVSLASGTYKNMAHTIEIICNPDPLPQTTTRSTRPTTSKGRAKNAWCIRGSQCRSGRCKWLRCK